MSRVCDLCGQKIRYRNEMGLTKTQAEIASLVAHGYTNQEIADHLFVCIETVRNHLAKIYKATGVKGRTQLAVHVLRLQPRSIA